MTGLGDWVCGRMDEEAALCVLCHADAHAFWGQATELRVVDLAVSQVLK